MFYTGFLLADAILAWLWWRAFRKHRQAWRKRADGPWHTLLMCLAASMLFATAILLAALTVLTLMMSLDSPDYSYNFGAMAFVMLWVPGGFLFGLGLMLAGSLQVWACKAYDEHLG